MMAGLLDQKPMAGAKPPMDSAQGMDSGAPRKASPEQQNEYTQFVSNGMLMMYSEQVMPQLLEMVRSTPDRPVAGLGNAVALVITRLEDSAAQSGKQVSEDVKLAAAQEITEQIADLAGPKGANIHEFTQEEIAGAFSVAAAFYGSARGGGAEGPGMAPEQPQQATPPAQQPGMGGGGGLMTQGAAY